MKKTLLLITCIFAFLIFANAQTKLSPAEKKMNDALCNCLTKIDFNIVTNADQANKAFMDCFTDNADLLLAIAEEKGVDITDEESSNKLGEQIGKNLMIEKCSVFMKLALLMANDGKEQKNEVTTGVFKRIDLKGFNYIVLNVNNSEASFLWLRQFPGSEQFIDASTKLSGKKLKISWQDMEVFLPAAKGYYKVKEITGIEFL